MYKIDLNSDLGESFGNYKLGLDESVLEYVSSANIACGWHAGDPLVMKKTIALAKAANVAVGAHTGYPDLLGFGRRNMSISPDEAYAYTLYQLGAFYGFAKAAGISVRHIKPHGAFYNMCAVDKKLAMGVCRAVFDFDPGMIMMALAGSRLVEAARETGLKAAGEFFADRAYADDGTLAPRTMEGSMIRDENEAIARTVKMIKTGTVTTISGRELEISCQSVCVHGDNDKAVQFVRKIKERLTAEGITIAPLSEIL